MYISEYKENYFTCVCVCVRVRVCVWSITYMFFVKINIDHMRHNNTNYFDQMAR